jgi:carboxymethylenebutenolidase
MTRAITIAILTLLTLPAAGQSTLENTPRHDEWVAVAQGKRKVHTYVVYPEVDHDAMAVVLIHENRGLTDWVRSVADRLAGEGYIALAPDLLSGMAPGGGRTRDFESGDAARQALGELDPAQVLEDLRAVIEYARAIPAADGKVAVAGFCWGGARAWNVANGVKGLAATFVFYGTGPQEAEAVANIDAPVYGFYAGNDQRVNATIPKTEELMKAAGRGFEHWSWEGSGHAFMRAGETDDASEANKAAAKGAMVRWLELLAVVAK